MPNLEEYVNGRFPRALMRLALRRGMARIAAASLWPAIVAGRDAPAEPWKPLTPAEAIASFQLEPGLRIELVASEPLVVDPVAFAFDERLRLYVVENRGYPDPLESSNDPWTKQGRVALLEDSNGDGRYDRRHEFATGLGYPNGIAVWRGGVIVTSAPDILYLKDNDGDGVADERRVLLTGFARSKTGQIRVACPTLGLDGWIYLACGRNGGEVYSPAHPERSRIKFDPVDSRFHPDRLLFELVGGSSQFGLAFDDFGRRFGVRNRHPVLHTVLEPWHLSRNPHLAFNTTMHEVSKVQHEAKVFPISRAKVTTHWADIYRPKAERLPHDGTFTSACGHHLFGGTALSPGHVGNIFICEPAQNLVQRQVMRPAGATFQSEPPYQGREFLASTDIAFRPVFLGTGPDGALYIADMYRREIDHPQYVPEQARPELDFVGPVGTGRIYRVVGGRRETARPVAPDLAGLCRELESANSWRRETAHRLLLERGDQAAAALLEQTATRAALPAARARALWALQGLGMMSVEIIERALRDSAPDVREQGIRLAGELVARGRDLTAALVATASDPDPRVRFVTALVLGDLRDARVVPALAAIAVRDGSDRWTRAAVLSGIGGRLEEFSAALALARPGNPENHAAVAQEFARVVGSGASLEECRRMLAQLLTEDRDLRWSLRAVINLAEGMRGREEFGLKKGGRPLDVLLPTSSREEFFGRLVALAKDDAGATPSRIAAVALLAQTDYDRAGQVLGALIGPQQPRALQLEAVRALERIGDPRGAEAMLLPRNWSGYTPQIRAAVISALTSRPMLVHVLFDAIAAGRVRASEIPSLRRSQLLKHNDARVRTAAEAVLQRWEGGDRMRVYQDYRDVLARPADVTKGAEPFTRACSACHTYQGRGGTVGPDLTGVRNQTADALLLHILVPNHEITPGYEAVTVTTRDARTLSGWLASESENSVTLRTAFDTEETIARQNIASLTATGVSLMPEGLEHGMTREELANVVAYLRQEPPRSPSVP